MTDRVPTHPGRVRLVPVAGQDNLYDLVRADDAITEGMPLCKATLLPDSVCDALGIDREESTPADALLAIPAVLGKALLSIQLLTSSGNPLSDIKIDGLTGIDDARCRTDQNGMLRLYVDAGTYSLTSADANQYIDLSVAPVSVTIRAGESKSVIVTAVTATTATIKSTSTIRFSRNVIDVDVFCVGGGGGGNGGYNSGDIMGNGGGGGYTVTQLKKSVAFGTAYSAIIGAGGAGSKEYDEVGKRGGSTSFMGVTAIGGYGGDGRHGGSGGSGGGRGGNSEYSSEWKGGNGGTDGGDGIGSGGKGTSGTGQGSTTRAFGESTGALYAGGGGGSAGGSGRGQGFGGAVGGGMGATGYTGQGYENNGGNGGQNTGGGGGGGYIGIGGTGGSGVIVIRWRNRA